LLEIAEKLEDRAERLKPTAQSVIRAVQGGVLAIDAMELLGEKAQTTFLEALALKHDFEALAECQFYGVQSHFDVESRMKEIRREVRELGRYFIPKKRKDAEWNAEAKILNCLIRTYRECNQFDEELAIQIRNRRIHRRLWFKKRMWILGDELRWLNPFYWLACYIHGLLKSIPVFVMALVLWVVGLSILYTATSPDSSLNMSEGFYRGVEDAVSSFFSIGSPIRHENGKRPSPVTQPSTIGIQQGGIEAHLGQIDNRLARLEASTSAIHTKVHEVKYTAGYVAVICLAIAAGFLHLGIFVSTLYSTVSRR
jgi:hypothetical protein